MGKTQMKKVKRISKTKVKCILKSFSCFVWDTFCNECSDGKKNQSVQMVKQTILGCFQNHNRMYEADKYSFAKQKKR